MKKLIIVAGLFFSFSSLAQDQDSWNEYGKEKYIIRYPKSWKLDTSKAMGTEFFLFSPLENQDDKFSENVNLIIQVLPDPGIDLKAYKEITEKQIPGSLTDPVMYESKIVSTQNGECYSVTYGMRQGPFKLKLTSICYIKDGRAYLLTFTSEQDKFERYKILANEILTSLSLLN